MTHIKRFLIFLYTLVTLRFVFRAFGTMRRDPRYLSFPLVGRFAAKVSVVLALLTWPVSFPLIRWRQRRAAQDVFNFIDQRAAQDEAWDISWPNDWDDDLTPEQERYWEGYFDDESNDDDDDDPLGLDEVVALANTLFGTDWDEDGEPVVILMTWTEDPSEAEVYAQANEDEKSPLYQGVTILGRH